MARTDPGNRTRYWLDSKTPGLSLLRADFTTHEYATHTHDALLIAVTDGGGAEITAGHASDEVHHRSLLVVNPGQPHSSRMVRSHRWRYRSFYLTPEAEAPLLDPSGTGRLPGFGRNVHDDPALVDLFLRLHRSIEVEADPMRREELEAEAFGALRDRYSSRPAVPEPPLGREARRLARALEMVRAGYPERLTLTTLASAVELTPQQVIALFRRRTGLTPHAYLTQVRLDAARRQLSRGVPIAEVALGVGFYDQSALSGHFKRAYAVTPAEYARATRGA
ncbi:MAG: helix-turn-helix domain-containing protein [Candidatus Dormibacteraceae bacterium]